MRTLTCKLRSVHYILFQRLKAQACRTIHLKRLPLVCHTKASCHGHDSKRVGLALIRNEFLGLRKNALALRRIFGTPRIAWRMQGSLLLILVHQCELGKSCSRLRFLHSMDSKLMVALVGTWTWWIWDDGKVVRWEFLWHWYQKMDQEERWSSHSQAWFYLALLRTHRADHQHLYEWSKRQTVAYAAETWCDYWSLKGRIWWERHWWCVSRKQVGVWLGTLEGTFLTIFGEVNYTLKMKKSTTRDVPNHVDPRQNLVVGATRLLHGHPPMHHPKAICHLFFLHFLMPKFNFQNFHFQFFFSKFQFSNSIFKTSIFK